MAEREKLIAILGPTASGKSSYAMELAQKLGSEIISGDAFLVYKGMDIGTAKPTPEEMQRVKHHLIDIKEPWESYSVVDFVNSAKTIISELNAKGTIPILAGGTGLYAKALLEGYKFSTAPKDEAYREELAQLITAKGKGSLWEEFAKEEEQSDLGNVRRLIRKLEIKKQDALYKPEKSAEEGKIVYDAQVIGLDWPREELYRRINRRVDMMMEAGLLDEVRRLLESGVSPQAQSMQAIGYRQLAAYFAGEYTLDEAVNAIKTATRHFAKRQLTWYRKMPYISWVTCG